MHKTYFNWSSGKDSALALYHLQQNSSYNVDFLLTSINTHFKRVSMHGLRVELLEEQFRSIGLPFGYLELDEHTTHEDYEQRIMTKTKELSKNGYSHAAFGDIFLEDLRAYRERQLSSFGIASVFPLWKLDTKSLMKEFLSLGFKTIVVCVNSEILDKSFAGRIIDEQFLKDLPDGIDPCGEHGEFHTFCFDGPIFDHPVEFSIGETILRSYKNGARKNGYYFCDLLPSKYNSLQQIN